MTSSIFSQAATQVIAALAPIPHGVSLFPNEPWWNDSGRIRFSKDDSLWSWFTRVMSGDYANRIIDHALNDHLILFASLHWKDSMLVSACIQVLISENCDLLQFYESCNDGRDCECHYYRLDLNPSEPGSLFREYLPHLHLRPHGEPRVSFKIGTGDNIILELLEFIYLNHFYDEWCGWAKTELAKKQFSKDLFETIIADSARDAHLTKEKHKSHILRIKQLLLEIKRSMPATKIIEECSIFNYH